MHRATERQLVADPPRLLPAAANAFVAAGRRWQGAGERRSKRVSALASAQRNAVLRRPGATAGNAPSVAVYGYG